MEISSKTIRFRYRNWRGEVAERVVTPTSLFFGKSAHHAQFTDAADRVDEGWYLVGYCHDRQAERHFALTSILEFI